MSTVRPHRRADGTPVRRHERRTVSRAAQPPDRDAATAAAARASSAADRRMVCVQCGRTLTPTGWCKACYAWEQGVPEQAVVETPVSSEQKDHGTLPVGPDSVRTLRLLETQLTKISSMTPRPRGLISEAARMAGIDTRYEPWRKPVMAAVQRRGEDLYRQGGPPCTYTAAMRDACRELLAAQIAAADLDCAHADVVPLVPNGHVCCDCGHEVARDDLSETWTVRD